MLSTIPNTVYSKYRLAIIISLLSQLISHPPLLLNSPKFAFKVFYLTHFWSLGILWELLHEFVQSALIILFTFWFLHGFEKSFIFILLIFSCWVTISGSPWPSDYQNAYCLFRRNFNRYFSPGKSLLGITMSIKYPLYHLVIRYWMRLPSATIFDDDI